MPNLVSYDFRTSNGLYFQKVAFVRKLGTINHAERLWTIRCQNIFWSEPHGNLLCREKNVRCSPLYSRKTFLEYSATIFLPAFNNNE
ncbi:hypothetical protein O3G_MSEX002816 [Manduca sexta]|uniref:Uncharacterized protein n=1 Tax=Manduca sexta TaxID=7130 RepID=A0A922CEI8_MANSE|nr:hypothetical protein O3G_MSEX002816 [Manduca sexta]KAG6443332.1 hypothetical protein O3G_MSEX002816 [Manduca sexta]